MNFFYNKSFDDRININHFKQQHKSQQDIITPSGKMTVFGAIF